MCGIYLHVLHCILNLGLGNWLAGSNVYKMGSNAGKFIHIFFFFQSSQSEVRDSQFAEVGIMCHLSYDLVSVGTDKLIVLWIEVTSLKFAD